MKKSIMIVIIVLIVVVILVLNKDFFLKKIYKIEYEEYVEKYCKEYNVDKYLIYSIIKQESNFNEGAMSSKGACGLMQLMDKTAKEIAQNLVMDYESGNTLFNPEKNIKLGIAYFSYLKSVYKNDNLAIVAYNAGSGNVNKWIKENIIREDGSDIENIPFKETNTYVRKILNNYKAICKALNLNYENIYRPYQTHTNVVKEITNERPSILGDDFKNVDGLITDKKNQILSLTFADCIPLTFYDPVKNVIGNIHSGWQGTYKEIARQAVRKLKEEFNCDPKNIICCIGPSIRKCCFETDEDVKNMFYDKFQYTGRINEIIQNSQEKFKYYIDTVLINMIILQEEGININNIIESGICTKCNSSKMHSHREDRDLAGRNTNLISLV